jgi:diguanylate cyclase (GGDEF)-like protein
VRATTKEAAMPRTRMRALQGLAFGIFAAPGWVLVQSLVEPGNTPGAELAAHPWLYAYLLAGAAAGFAVFGAMLGHREDALLDANRRLDALSVSDPLTDLKNVRYFRARLEEARASALRAGEPLSLVVLDLDRFKEVNDRFGHPTGDALLRRVADAISSAVRGGDTAARLNGSVARMGGEEFAVLLPGADEDEALEIADRILEAVRSAVVRTGRGAVQVSASAGVAALDGAEVSADELYARADRAMYASKAAGRDRSTVWCAVLDDAAVLEEAWAPAWAPVD